MTGSQFEPIEDRNFCFSGCTGCQSRCCDGRAGVLFTQIVLEEFEAVCEHFAIVFIFGELGFAKPVILLTNGRDYCRYLQEFQCTIYDARPATCRTYPISPEIDDRLYIDRACPAVGTQGAPLVTGTAVEKSFHAQTLQNYQEKYLQTYHHFNDPAQTLHFEPAVTINGLLFYKLTAKSKGHHIAHHHHSLRHLNDGYFSGSAPI